MNKGRRHNTRLASCGVTCLHSSSVFQLGFGAGLTVLCSEIPHERQAWERSSKCNENFKQTKNMTNFLRTILVSILLTGCVSTAKISDFSQTSSSIDFDKLSKEFKQTKTPFWTLKTSNEYYFEKETDIDETKLVEAIKNGLHSYNYNVAVANTEDKCVIGKRGMMANEWSSITAVYYKMRKIKFKFI